MGNRKQITTYNNYMTRINTCIPKALTDQHLIGEYNEIRRPVQLAINKYNKHAEKGFDIPSTYRLGPGHVIFFYDKLKYIHKRFDAICEEMKIRGFNVNTGFDKTRIPDRLYNDWEPSKADNDLLVNRLIEKIQMSSIQWRYYKQPISETYIKFLKDYEQKAVNS